ARLHRYLPDQCGLHASKLAHAHAYLCGLRGDLRSLREELRRRRRYGRVRPYLPGVRRELPPNGGGLNVTSPEENPMRTAQLLGLALFGLGLSASSASSQTT